MPELGCHGVGEVIIGAFVVVGVCTETKRNDGHFLVLVMSLNPTNLAVAKIETRRKLIILTIIWMVKGSRVLLSVVMVVVPREEQQQQI